MKLFEYEAKRILDGCGVAVPKGRVAVTPDEAAAAAAEIGGRVAVKAQILVAGRGKAGGIKFAADPAEARSEAAALLGKRIKDIPVGSLLVEAALDIADQYYLSVTTDRTTRSYVVLASTEGGVDIEEVAASAPEKIARHRVDPLAGFGTTEAASLMSEIGLTGDAAAKLGKVLVALFAAAMDNDAELAELNPIVRTTAGEFVAADARMIIDDNAMFRHPEFEERDLSEEEYTPLEVEAKKYNLAYVDLDGDIGVVGNGAGLVMATLDMVKYYGGEAANFLDAGGGGNLETTKQGLRIVMSKPAVKAVLVNILGGITRCDIVAQAVIEAMAESGTRKPISVRMIGTNEEEGIRMLKEAGINCHSTMEEAVKEIIAAKQAQ